MGRPLHIIERQRIEVEFENFSDGFGVQREIGELFHRELLPQMEALFDGAAPDNCSIAIEKLDIDCGMLSQKNWKAELIHETLRGLRAQLASAHKKTNETKPHEATEIPARNAWESLFFFLEKGYLPWNSRTASLARFGELLRDNEGTGAFYTEKLKGLLEKNISAKERFVNCFLNGSIEKTEAAEKTFRTAAAASIVRDIKKTPEANPSAPRKTVDKELLQPLLRHGPDMDHSAFDAGGRAIERKENGEKNRNGPSKNTERDAIYIHNAGLVILHPFMPALFHRLGFVSDRKWIDAGKQHAAVSVFGYLVSGQETFAEFDLPLNKIICGLAPTDVLAPIEEIQPGVKEECAAMLAEVIGHWPALKRTGTEGLRETFLQREGKLTQVENGWLLNVEQKGVDILLNSLPWGIGTIKLPWALEKLHVEWPN